jgi:N-acetylneuraminic acid mutarotase
MDLWTTNLSDAPNPRDHTGGGLVNGQICVAGGRNSGVDDFFNITVVATDCYDLESGLWEVKAAIPQGRAGSAYGTTCDGKLMVAGGEGFGQAWANVDLFDGSSWETVDSLNTARHGTGLAISCSCNEIYIASGSGDQGGSPELITTERYLTQNTTCSHS